MFQKQVICDHCKSVRKESNHWWMMYRTDDETGIVIEPLGHELDFDTPALGEKHLCSANCVVKEVSAFIQPAKENVLPYEEIFKRVNDDQVRNS